MYFQVHGFGEVEQLNVSSVISFRNGTFLSEIEVFWSWILPPDLYPLMSHFTVEWTVMSNYSETLSQNIAYDGVRDYSYDIVDIIQGECYDVTVASITSTLIEVVSSCSTCQVNSCKFGITDYNVYDPSERLSLTR